MNVVAKKVNGQPNFFYLIITDVFLLLFQIIIIFNPIALLSPFSFSLREFFILR